MWCTDKKNEPFNYLTCIWRRISWIGSFAAAAADDAAGILFRDNDIVMVISTTAAIDVALVIVVLAQIATIYSFWKIIGILFSFTHNVITNA